MQKSRKKFWIIFTSVVASIVLICLVCGLGTRLKTVTVEIRKRADVQYTMLDEGIIDKVAEAGDFGYGKSVLFMNFEDNIVNIEKSNPYVKVEQIIRHFPNIAKVYISERTPRYRIRDKEDANKWYILDADFKVLDMVTGGESAISEQNYGRNSSYYEYTIKIMPESLTISAHIGSFVTNDSVKNYLNSISSGVISALGSISLVKSVAITDATFTLTMKNSGINDDNGCEISLVGTDNLAKKAQAGALAYADATDTSQSIDLSGKVITISYENGVYKGIMSDKETA